MRKRFTGWQWFFVFLFLVGCNQLGITNTDKYNKKYGKTQPINRVVAQNSKAGQHYFSDVKPLLEKRCVVCHACYDAPCQLKLSSPEGIDRGASKKLVYDGTRLLAEEPTRLGIDVSTTRDWRDKQFSPVLNERTQDLAHNTQLSVLYQMLALKKQNPLPGTDLLSNKFELGLDRKQQCPAIEEFDAYKKEHADWGMPYGLPGLTPKEHEVLAEWVANGGLMSKRPALPSIYEQNIQKWEHFLNGDSLKQQLAARYIYEHLFLAHLYFDELPGHEFFEIVRSVTPPGQPISIIATRLPHDDPGVKRVYYRIRRDESTVVAKTHMPYPLNDKRLSWMQSLFSDPVYQVTTLPSYSPDIAANPFKAFSQLPVKSRYRFMLENAHFTIMTFIKGPVCRGQIALNVIDDHFWVFFVNPDEQDSATLSKFLNEQSDNLALPNRSEESDIATPKVWIEYTLKTKAYFDAKNAALNEVFSTNKKIDLNLIWDGGGANQNAALTIFRHFDSASVEQGLLGQPPKTAWIISYPLLERIYYLLVAGFDVYGNISHQLNTRLYMDFLRMEGEFNFLAFLPKTQREELRNYWYRDTDLEVRNYLFEPYVHLKQSSDIVFKTSDPKLEFYGMLKNKLSAVLNRNHDFTTATPETLQPALQQINSIKGHNATLFPELSMLLVTGDNHPDQVFTLVRNTGHSNISIKSLINEQSTRLPNEDYMSVLKGVVGAYPAVFWRVSEHDLTNFARDSSHLKSEDDYKALLKKYGIRRTSPAFWATSDKLIDAYQANAPIDAGLLDYSRLENR